MKNCIINRTKLIIALLGMAFASCGDEGIADAVYPEEVLYMPAAVNGFFRIDDIPVSPANVPTAGAPARFSIDYENGNITVPLGVYRSGVSNSGVIKVDIEANADTVINLINSGKLEGGLLLPADKYFVQSSVELLVDKESAPFDLNIDLDFLKNNPDRTFAVGVQVSSSQRQTNPKLNTTIVVIDTEFLVPSADFTFNGDPDDWRKINFTNTSAYYISATWDFGDGSTSDENSPNHIFSGAGVYPVKLTVKGLTGEESVKIVNVRVYNIEDIENVALNKPARTSDDFNTNYTGKNAVDGVISNASRWLSTAAGEHWIEIDLEREYDIVSFKTLIGANGSFGYPIRDFIFQAEINGKWENIVDVKNNSNAQYESMFPIITTSKVRYYVPNYSNNMVRLYEIYVYGFP